MTRFKRRLDTIRVILRHLERSPCQWTPLMKHVLRHSTPWLAQSCLDWLLAEEYLERPFRGSYQLSQKGLALLRAIE